MSAPIRVGFVGAGWMGRVLLQRLVERDDVTICGLHQRDEERARAVLRELGLEESLYRDSYDELVRQSDVDAMFLCSTNEVHGAQAIAALEQGKHVFLEKPCATRFEEFVREIELSRKHPELITFVDYLMNFDTLEQRIQEMVKRGDFGTLTQIQVNYRHPINIEGEKAWKLRGDRMGDAIGMGIIHSISVMSKIMEAQGTQPKRVYANHSSHRVRDFDLPALWNLHIEFEDGSTGLCFGNVDHGNGYDAYHNLHGTEGGLIFDSYLDRPQKIRYWSQEATEGRWVYPLDGERCRREGMEQHCWPEDSTTPDSGDVVHHQTGRCVEHFLNCVHTGTESFLSFENTRSLAEIGWAAQMAAEWKRPVDLPLDWNEAAAFFESR